MRHFRQKLCSGNRPLDPVCEYKDHVDKVDKIRYIIRTRAARGYFELFSVEGIETLCKAFKVIGLSLNLSHSILKNVAVNVRAQRLSMLQNITEQAIFL
jgi:hypothetical protein